MPHVVKRQRLAIVVYGGFIAAAAGAFLFGLAISLGDAADAFAISRDPSCRVGHAAPAVAGSCAWKTLVLVDSGLRDVSSRAGSSFVPFVVVSLPNGSTQSLDVDYDLYDDVRTRTVSKELYGLLHEGRIVWIASHDEESDTSASPWGRFQKDGVPLVGGSVACVFVFAMRASMRNAARARAN